MTNRPAVRPRQGLDLRGDNEKPYEIEVLTFVAGDQAGFAATAL